MDPIHSLTLGDLLRENRRSHPLRTAVVCGETRLRYPELDERVNRLASALAGAGVGPGGRVLWLGQNCHRLLECLLAAAKLGAVFCPANWRGSVEELGFAIRDFAAGVVVWQEAEIGERVRAARAGEESRRAGPSAAAGISGAMSPSAAAGTSGAASQSGAASTSGGANGSRALWVQLDGTGEGSYEHFLAGGSPEDRDVEVDPLSPVLAIYTAAFSGRPSAALLSHGALIVENLAIALLQRASHETIYLNSGPLFHVGSFMTTLVAFHLGGTNVFQPRFDAEEFCRLVERERCTAAYVVGPMMERILEANRDRRFDLKSLRSFAGPEAWNAMVTVEKTPWTADPGGYGQTELDGLVTFRGLGGPGAGSHGRTLPLAQLRIVDAAGRELPAGEVGEIVVRGPTVMTGYHDRAEENAARRRGGWHHTADLGRREADGSITFVGPMTAMIKSGVENIYPAEIEAAIARHPAVAAACVIGVPDAKWQQSVKAVVVAKPGAKVTAEEIIEHCKAHLASYKKPRAVAIVDALPRNEIGMIDRAAVDARFGGGGYPGPERTTG